MGITVRNLKDTITHWPYTGSDSYGGYTFGTPVTMMGRWEERREVYKSLSGEEKISRAVVYLESDVELQDYIAEGDHTDTSDPTTLDGAYRVEDFQRITDLRSLNTLRKAML